MRSVGYCRQRADVEAERRITRSGFDASAYCVARWDARLWQAGQVASQRTLHGLRGKPLLAESQDAGWRITLAGEAGQMVAGWDSQSNLIEYAYDDCLRLLTITERPGSELPAVVERLLWARADEAPADSNQRGRVLRHDDRAGSERIHGYSLNGVPTQIDRVFLAQPETPHWPLDPDARAHLLESTVFSTAFQRAPLGELLSQTDAMGGLRRFSYTVSGQLREVSLQPPGQARQVLAQGITYDVHEQMQSQFLGNGVHICAEYAPADGRLVRLHAAAPGEPPLQDLRYTYDPVGNVLEVSDKTVLTTFFRNQRVDAVSRYRYDSLYQLVEASGRECAMIRRDPHPDTGFVSWMDPTRWVNYTRHYHYDAAGNLMRRAQSGGESFSCAIAQMSNRSLPQYADGSLPDEAAIAAAFDGCGNLLVLPSGKTLGWDAANQLSRITWLHRQDGDDDGERYHYDHRSRRVRKVSSAVAQGRACNRETRYLPGLEIHWEGENLQWYAFDVEAGRSRIRMLHWPANAKRSTGDSQYRYSVLDHLGSCSLELDEAAALLSHEGYYPFGGTSWWAARSELEAARKRHRYCGRERDASGLYYYGRRYYASALQRWISPDPLGDQDGLNRYRMVRNNPLAFFDSDGLIATLVHKADITAAEEVNDLSRSNEVRHLRMPIGDVVHKDLSADFAMDQDSIDLQRLRASNEVFAYALSQQTLLVQVPSTRLVEGHDREVVSSFITPATAPAAISPETRTRLKVFDFLLASRDRHDKNGEISNVIYDGDGTLHAIDHEHSLGLGAASSKPHPAPVLVLDETELEQLARLPRVLEGLRQTEWGAFYDRQTQHLAMADRAEIIASRKAFLTRIEQVVGALR